MTMPYRVFMAYRYATKLAEIEKQKQRIDALIIVQVDKNDRQKYFQALDNSLKDI